MMPTLALSYEASFVSRLLSHPLLFLAVAISLFFVLGWKARKEFEWTSSKPGLEKQIEQRSQKIFKLLKTKDQKNSAIEALNLGYYVLGEISGHKGGSLELQKLLAAAPPSVRQELGEKLRAKFDLLQVYGFAPEEVVKTVESRGPLADQIHDMVKLLKKAVEMDRSTSDKLSS